MIKSITNFLLIFFIFQQLKSQISQIDQNGYNAFCDETLHLLRVKVSVKYILCEVPKIGSAQSHPALQYHFCARVSSHYYSLSVINTCTHKEQTKVTKPKNAYKMASFSLQTMCMPPCWTCNNKKKGGGGRSQPTVPGVHLKSEACNFVTAQRWLVCNKIICV